ncbi:MAG: D-alanine--D-alanine ligase [Bacteroidales bacterium]|nr:D-alanine--D-alanine ligase [Bacteroidales bacterium]MBR0304805.1 D-alanine--D-alanine ligase [Bacteroidales bacterium]
MYNVAIIAGGDSGEYEISLKTADNIFNQLDRNQFTPYLIHFKGADWTYKASDGTVYQIDKNDFTLNMPDGKVSFDVAFIAIHGTPGENGRLQAYFELVGQPYTGCGVFCSALTFNKYYCNLAVAGFGVPISPSLHFYNTDPIDYEQIESVCGYPCFVKACNSGSSVGVTKVHNRSEIDQAFAEAFKFDNQLMVEKFVRGREFTCGVTSVYGEPRVLAVTEVVASNEFYDYNAKYTAVGHKLITPADIPAEMTQKLGDYAKQIFHNLDCHGVVRIDFIISEDDGVPYFLEVNTIPGQTALSIVPGQVEYNNLDIKEFYTKMVMEALTFKKVKGEG